jgi:hypothetical protein
VLQLVAIKRRQAQGHTLAEIQAELVGATDRTLRRIAEVATTAERIEPATAAKPRQAFWREPAAKRQEVGVLAGLDLGDGVVLMLPARPNPSDVELIRAAAQPLLELLAERRLTRRSVS